MIVTQEQVDQYVTETLQPLVNELLEFAKGKNIPPTDFYLVCIALIGHVLGDIGDRKADLLREELSELGSAWATEELRRRMESEK
jgi:hypothetical protein